MKKREHALSWQPSGHHYRFDEEAIRASAPPASGVYGLYNADYQIFIGESADIQRQLMRHYREVGVQAECYRPTGFTFEVCSAESRAEKAQQLIVQYRPVLQAPTSPGDTWSLDSDRVEAEAAALAPGAKNGFDFQKYQPPIIETRPTILKRFYFARGQVAALTIIYATSLAIIFYLGVLTGESLERKANAGAQALLGKSPVPAPVAEDPPAASGSSAAPVLSEKNAVIPFESVKQPAEEGPPANREEVVFSKSTEPATRKSARGSNESTRAAGGIKTESSVHSSKESLSQPAEGVEPAAMWTVQIAASMAKESSAQQLDRLKAKGYDGYIVETERDGRVWYRVRVGHFGSRAEAETLRSRLQTQEGFQNAFIARK